MKRICPRCGAQNFENATQCAECQMTLLASEELDAAAIEERLRRARELVAANRYDQAIVQLVPASAAAPQHAEVQRLLGRAYQAKGSAQHAIRAFQAAVRAQPKDALTHYELGVAQREAGRTEEAVAEFNIALQIDPELQQAKAAYNQLTVERDKALQEAREMAPAKPRAAAPELGPVAIPRRAHLLDTRNGIALLIGIGVAFVGSYGLGILFGLSTSPELADRLPAFEQFIPRWLPVLAALLGLIAASCYTHKIPLVGLVAGAFAGWAAIMLAAGMAEVEVNAAWLHLWVPASAGIAAGVESFAKFTHLNDRRKFLALACSLGLAGYVANGLLRQGRLYGYVRHHVTQEDILYEQSLAGVEITLVAADNAKEIYRTKTRAATEVHKDDEWLGSYTFDRLPLQRYRLLIRNPFDGKIVTYAVEAEYAVTNGTQYDVYLYARPGAARKPPGTRPRKG